MCYWKKNKFWKTWNVIIHHTAFDMTNFDFALETISKEHYNRFVTPFKKDWMDMCKSNTYNKAPYIAYHYVIWKNWEIQNTRWVDQVWYQCWN